MGSCVRYTSKKNNNQADLLDTANGNRIQRTRQQQHTVREIRIENHFFDSVRVIHFGWMGRETQSMQLVYEFDP